MTFPPARDPLFLAAYWTGAGESVEDISERLSRFILSIAELDPSLSAWFRVTDPGRGQLVDPSPSALAVMLEAAWAEPHVDRDLRRLLGVAAALSTSPSGNDDAIGLTMRAGASSVVQNVDRSYCMLRMLGSPARSLPLLSRDVALALMRTMVECWRPDWCTWSSRQLQTSQGWVDGEVIAGWATYLAGPSGVRSRRLPAGVSTALLPDGVLVVADGDADAVTATAVSNVKAVLSSGRRPALRYSFGRRPARDI